MDFSQQLQRAWQSRKLTTNRANRRIFHGPGEGQGILKKISIDVFGNFAWVNVEGEPTDLPVELTQFLKEKSIDAASVIFRKRKGIETEPCQSLYGELPERLNIEHQSLKLQLRIKNQRHPGLFLDLDHVRNCLLQNSTDQRVLNLFSFTASLSLAAAKGGAHQVTSIDLSKPFTEWAKENWQLNKFNAQGDFIFGDVFEWLTKFKKQKRQFDIIVCDPPSFSRSGSKTFSTEKDSVRLHEHILSVLAPQGRIVTTINSEKIERFEFLKLIAQASQSRRLLVEGEIQQPSDFPTILSAQDLNAHRYLKGFILRALD